MKRNSVQRLLVGLVTVSTAVESDFAVAEPNNPGPTVNALFLGELGIGQTIDSGNVPIVDATYAWFGFRLTSAITPLENWLDIDTSGANTIGDTELALYDANQNLISINDRSGTGEKAAMSFGGGSGERLSRFFPGGAISIGINGDHLPAGVYWACIGFHESAGPIFPNPNPDWTTNIPPAETRTGNVRVRIMTGQVVRSQWNEGHHGVVAGEIPTNAQRVQGSGMLDTILLEYGDRLRKMFKVQVCDGAGFSVTADVSSPTDSTFPSRLYLFGLDGRGVLAVEGSVPDANTVLNAPSGALPVGEYFLAISSRCPGENGFEGVPYDADGSPIWSFAVRDQSIVPDGVGAANPLAYWGTLSNCEGNSFDTYHARLTLTGACFVSEVAACPIDLNTDNRSDLSDFAIFQNCFGKP